MPALCSSGRKKPLDDIGLSEVQGTLFLLAVVLIAAILVKTTIGDGMVNTALEFGKFRVWGSHNDMGSYNGAAPSIEITSPANGSVFYCDQEVGIFGSVIPDAGQMISFVYYKINEGPWIKASLSLNDWYGQACRYPEGKYRIEAVAYDDSGERSSPAMSIFESFFRLYPDSKYIDDNIPDTMTANDIYCSGIKYLNTGYLSWNLSSGYSLSPYLSDIFHVSAAAFVPGEEVLPSSEKTFNITFLAPSTPGVHQCSLRMQSAGYGWFGERFTKNITVVEPVYDARIVSVDFPSEMLPGEIRAVSITVQNTGTAAWYAIPERLTCLGMIGGLSGDAYKFNGSSDRIYMSPASIIRQGENYTFSFQITAPAPGTYTPGYRMLLKNGTLFGESATQTIHVISPTPTPPAPTPDPYQAYIATGTMTLIQKNGQLHPGCISYVYDGPLCSHYSRASYYESWDIGGPNGHYRIYKDQCIGELQFEMNYGGPKGSVTFREI
ncbi:hypothetical protein CUJ83_07165 [Methanocella sp. CWC-04]|uniref:Uncharacterized protein n=1 Tax=Methanooceanicella nereidis TaxID=2052831 RepID=A0AAP2W617_9EURY|nr:hypothetical protein [Methanocella sp. CWC-04]MCD1294777.1 hypothetical protein [Methanocella sp. CWC-04]